MYLKFKFINCYYLGIISIYDPSKSDKINTIRIYHFYPQIYRMLKFKSNIFEGIKESKIRNSNKTVVFKYKCECVLVTCSRAMTLSLIFLFYYCVICTISLFDIQNTVLKFIIKIEYTYSYWATQMLYIHIHT